MAPINLCEVVNNLDVGGIERMVLSLVHALPPEKIKVHLVCLSGAGRLFGELQIPRERCLVLDKGQGGMRDRVGFPRTLLALRRFLDEHDIDVVHTHNLGPLVFGGIAARSTRPRARLVFSDHGQVINAIAKKRRRFQLYARMADQLVGVSENVTQILTTLGIPRPARAIHNGIDGARYATARGDGVRRELGIDPAAFVVGTAVRVTEQKGLVYLIEAAVRVAKEAPAIQYVVAGDGPLRVELTARAEAAGLGEKFRFVGYRSDVPEIVASFDVYTLPSVWEGLPLSLLEAMAAGKTIVATTVGGNPEIVQDGVHGFLVPPADPEALATAILSAYRDRDHQEERGRRNRERFAKYFSLDVMVNKHVALFEDLAAGR